MSLKSERDDYPENSPIQPVKTDPSNRDKCNLQPDRFGDMSPEAFAELAKYSGKPSETNDDILASSRVSLSYHLDKTQPTPEELINQGKGSGVVSLCQKL